MSGGVLEFGGEFVGVGRADAGVVQRGGEQHGGVGGAGSGVVVRGVAQQRLPVVVVGGVAEFVDPPSPQPQMRIADHVGDRIRADRGRVQLWVAGDRHRDHQPAVRGAADGELVGRCPALSVQPAGGGAEVGEGVGFVAATSSLVPGGAVFGAATYTGDRIDSAGLDPGEQRGAVGGCRGDPETAVGRQDRRTRPPGHPVAIRVACG